MEFYASLGRRLRELRIRAGLSQAALGARLGRSTSAIDRYEMGQRRISIADPHRLARILGVPPARLLGGRQDMLPGTRLPTRGRRDTPAQSSMEGLRAEHRRLLRELDRRLSGAALERQHGAWRETPRPYTRSHRVVDTAYASDAYTASLSPARLRDLARRARWHGGTDPEVLRRYAALVLEDFARRGGSATARRRIDPGNRRDRGAGPDAAGDKKRTATQRTPPR